MLSFHDIGFSEFLCKQLWQSVVFLCGVLFVVSYWCICTIERLKILCNNTIKENGALINSTETSLKLNLKKGEYRSIEEVILQNEECTIRTLKQQKSKKLNYLKQKPADDENSAA